MSGQDEPNAALSLATRASKIALSCPFGITLKKKAFFPYNKSFIERACSGGYWPRYFFARSWTSQKENLANISHLDRATLICNPRGARNRKG